MSDSATGNEVQRQLAKICNSRQFALSRRLQTFLTFLVDAAQNGKSAELKEFIIAVEVYGRSSDFDPKLDSIVRTETNRLRKKLEEYYQSGGAGDDILFTLPKGGYALQIQTIKTEHVPAPLSPQRPGGALRGLSFALTGILLVSLGVMVWLWRNPNRPNTPTITVLAAYPGYQFHPSLSPDGKQLAFVWNGTDDNYDIYIKRVGDEESRRLTVNPAQDLSPAWSPDGKQIAFLRVEPNQQALYIVPAAGGTERKVGDITPVATSWVAEPSVARRLPGPAWSPDGQSIAVADRCNSSAQTTDCIYLLSIDGLQRKRLTSGAPIGDYSPAFSPDGKEIVFIRTFADVGLSDLYVQRIGADYARRLTSDQKSVGSVAWSKDRGILFVSNRTGASQLWNIPASGGEPAVVNGVPRSLLNVSASAGSKRIAVAGSYRNVNIWRTDLTSKNPTPHLLIRTSRISHSAQYSADGSRIVFVSDRSGSPEIWVCAADGADVRRLTFSNDRPIGSPSWSPDGKSIVYDSSELGYSQIFVMNADGTNARRFSPDSWDDMMPTWSRNGLFIYYVAQKNGIKSLWKKPLDGGMSIQLVDDGASDAYESLDGTRVVYSKFGHGIWEVNASGGNDHPIPELASMIPSRYLFVGSQGIYYATESTTGSEVRVFDFATRQIRRVVSIDRKLVYATHSLAVSGDGKWMLHAQVDQNGSEISMLGGS